MVKGISKQVIVVKSPDPRFFEQAIFIVREDALGREGVTDEEILKEAGRVADGYARTGVPRVQRILGHIPLAAYTAFGALAVGVLWIVSSLI